MPGRSRKWPGRFRTPPPAGPLVPESAWPPSECDCADSCTRCSPRAALAIETLVEVAAQRGCPGKRPPHPPLVRLQLASGARDTADSVTSVRQVDDRAVEPVGDRRARGTARRVIRPEHEVVDEELRAPLKRSISDALPSSVSNVLFPMRLTATPAVAAPAVAASRVRSPLDRSIRAARHSSRVPVLCVVILLRSCPSSFVRFPVRRVGCCT